MTSTKAPGARPSSRLVFDGRKPIGVNEAAKVAKSFLTRLRRRTSSTEGAVPPDKKLENVK
jgi:hypothetical protein